MWNLAPLLPPGSYTRMYRGTGELIDHIFVSRSLLRPDLEVHTVHETALPSITERPTVHLAVPGSDHAPIVAVLDA